MSDKGGVKMGISFFLKSLLLLPFSPNLATNTETYANVERWLVIAQRPAVVE